MEHHKRMNVCGEQEWMLAIWLSKRRMMKKWWFSGCYQNMIALAKSDIRDTQIACHIDVTQNFGPPRRNGLTSDSRRTVAVSSLTRQSESWRTVAVVSLTRQSWFQLWRFPIAAVRETSLLSGPKNNDKINESPAKEGLIHRGHCYVWMIFLFLNFSTDICMYIHVINLRSSVVHGWTS